MKNIIFISSVINKLYIRINSITKEFVEYIDNGKFFKKDDLFVVIEYVKKGIK